MERTVRDTVRDTFSLAGNMNFWGDVYTATLLPSGTVLFVGNDENDGTPAYAEVFDPLVVAFTRIHSAAANHEYGDATLLPEGTVLITGGQLPGGNGEFVSEIYVPASDTFSAADNMLTARHEHTATLLADGTVLIAGGYSSWPSARRAVSSGGLDTRSVAVLAFRRRERAGRDLARHYRRYRIG
jgi:hypothetical protein